MIGEFLNPRLRCEGVKSMIEDRYKDSLSRCRETLEIFMEILDVVEQKEAEVSHSQTVLHLLMVQSFNDFWCVILLCSYGNQLSASSQLRNMVNRLIDTKFIFEGDSESLSVRWIEFTSFQMDKYWRKRETRGDSIQGITPEQRSEIQANAQIYRDTYGGKSHNDWSGHTIYAKASSVGLKRLYEELYWNLSNMAHSNVIGSTPYYIGNGKFRIGPQEEFLNETLDITGSIFLKQLEIWREHLGLDVKDQEVRLSDIWQDFQ